LEGEFLMSYETIKEAEKKWAEKVVSELNNSTDKYVVYRTSRPITDLKNMLKTSVELYGENVAFMQKFEKNQPYKEITYEELFKTVNALGTSLINKGLKGKRIAVIGENCYQWAVSYLAVICGTGIVVPLDKELGDNELKHLIKESQASAVIFTEKYAERFKAMKDSGETELELLIKMNGKDKFDHILEWEDLVEAGDKLIREGDRCFLDAEIYADEMSELLFTSGTTGLAKGVMLSQKNICFDLMIAPTILNVNDWDIFFSVLPIHHTYECTCGFLMPLYKGAAIAYCEGLKYITKNLQEVRPTMFLGVPVLFETLYKGIMKNIRKQGKEATVQKVMKASKVTEKIGINLNKLLLKDIYKVFGGRMRVLISGGAAIDPAILQFFNDLGFVAVQGYGLSECAPMGALNPDQHKYMRNASVGHILPCMDVKIVDKDEEGIGEICLKGDNVMLGYYNMPEETAKVIKDGWFYTGDQGYIDDEKFIYITGRKKNVIIASNGKNVFPEELEYYLSLSPYIAESMVWGAEDEKTGDIVIVAAIRPEVEEVEAALGKEDAKDLEKVKTLLWKEVDKINADQPLFKKIRKISVRTEEFKKNTSKKIIRFAEENKKI
jgi:long-subunit acyl-CoA synthetase (AMP-forming)